MSRIRHPPQGDYLGRSPPGYDDDWQMQTVCIRARKDDERLTCAHTGGAIDVSDHHLYLTIRRERRWDTEVDHLAFVDEEAFREWLHSAE